MFKEQFSEAACNKRVEQEAVCGEHMERTMMWRLPAAYKKQCGDPAILKPESGVRRLENGTKELGHGHLPPKRSSNKDATE